jgi:hypothetical protein
MESRKLVSCLRYRVEDVMAYNAAEEEALTANKSTDADTGYK